MIKCLNSFNCAKNHSFSNIKYSIKTFSNNYVYFICYFVTISGITYSLSSNLTALIFDPKSGRSFRESVILGFFLLALGGLPPFINFWAKLLGLKVIIFSSPVGLAVAFILVIITAWLMFIYLSLIDKFILKNNLFNFTALKFYRSKSVFLVLIPLAGS